MESTAFTIAERKKMVSKKLYLNHHQEEFDQINQESRTAITIQTMDLDIKDYPSKIT